MQGMVPEWDMRVARARRPSERDLLEAYIRSEYGGGPTGPGSLGDGAPDRVRWGVDRFVRIVLLNLRRVRAVPAPA